jgi:hypothetical protein
MYQRRSMVPRAGDHPCRPEVSVQRLHILIVVSPGHDGYPDNNRPVQPLGSRTVAQRVS